MKNTTDGDCSLGVLILYVLFMAVALALVITLAHGKDGFSWRHFWFLSVSPGLILWTCWTLLFVDYLRKVEKQ